MAFKKRGKKGNYFRRVKFCLSEYELLLEYAYLAGVSHDP